MATAVSTLTLCPGETNRGLCRGRVRTAAPTTSPRSISGVCAPKTRSRFLERADEPALGATDGGAVEQHADVGGESEAARVGVPLAVEEEDIRLDGQIDAGGQHRRPLPKREQPRDIRKDDRFPGDRRCDHLQRRERHGHDRRAGLRSGVVAQVGVVDAGNDGDVVDGDAIVQIDPTAEIDLDCARLGRRNFPWVRRAGFIAPPSGSDRRPMLGREPCQAPYAACGPRSKRSDSSRRSRASCVHYRLIVRWRVVRRRRDAALLLNRHRRNNEHVDDPPRKNSSPCRSRSASPLSARRRSPRRRRRWRRPWADPRWRCPRLPSGLKSWPPDWRIRAGWPSGPTARSMCPRPALAARVRVAWGRKATKSASARAAA